jgi:hypothetical protein
MRRTSFGPTLKWSVMLACNIEPTGAHTNERMSIISAGCGKEGVALQTTVVCVMEAGQSTKKKHAPAHK